MRWSSYFRRCMVAVVLAATLHGADRPAAPESDEQIVAEMQRQIKALQQQVVETQDTAATARLHAQINELMEDALARVSPKSRPMLEIGLKLLRPLSEQGVAYTVASSAFFESPRGDPSTLQNRAEIPARIEALEKLAAQNQQLLDRINAMEGEAEKLVRKTGISAQEREAFMAGYRQSAGRNLGALRAIRSLDAKVLKLWTDLLHLLDREWGRWHAGADSKIVWDDAQAEATANAIVEEMNTLADRQVAAQKTLVGTK